MDNKKIAIGVGIAAIAGGALLLIKKKKEEEEEPHITFSARIINAPTGTAYWATDEGGMLGVDEVWWYVGPPLAPFRIQLIFLDIDYQCLDTNCEGQTFDFAPQDGGAYVFDCATGDVPDDPSPPEPPPDLPKNPELKFFDIPETVVSGDDFSGILSIYLPRIEKVNNAGVHIDTLYYIHIMAERNNWAVFARLGGVSLFPPGYAEGEVTLDESKIYNIPLQLSTRSGLGGIKVLGPGTYEIIVRVLQQDLWGSPEGYEQGNERQYELLDGVLQVLAP